MKRPHPLGTPLCILFGFFAACQPEVEVSSSTLSFPVTVAQCPALSNTSTLKARLFFDYGNGTLIRCDLNVKIMNGAVTADGSCPNLPAAGQPVLIAEWYVAAMPADIIVAEAVSQATQDFSTYDRKNPPLLDFADINYTSAYTGTDAVERDRFNCDVSGVYLCGTKQSSAAGASAVDSCSNLDELCRGTLLNAQSLSDACL